MSDQTQTTDAPVTDTTEQAITPEQYQALQDEVERMRKHNETLLAEKKAETEQRKAEQAGKDALAQEQARKKGDFDTLEKQYQDKIAKLEAELAKHEQKYADLVKANNTKFIESTAKDIARSLATNDINAELLQTLIQGRITIDENGVPRILGADGQPSIATIDDFKNEIKSSGRYDALIVGTSASGVGSQGQGTQGTKTLKDYTEGELIELQKTNPAEFTRIINQ